MRAAWRRALPPRSAGDRRRRLGRRGELRARRALRRRGYEILAANLRSPAGEIDILARQEGQIVLVEVKSGRARAEAEGGEARLVRRFGRAQRARQRAVVRWLRRQKDFRNASFRHDLVVVTFAQRRSVVTIRRNVMAHPAATHRSDRPL